MIEDNERFIYGLKGLRHSDTYIGNLFYPKEEYETYSKNKLFIGWTTEYRWPEHISHFDSRFRRWDKYSERKPLFLDISTSSIIIILGTRGSGKTFTLLSMLSRLHKSGEYHTIHLSDIKGEMRGATEPLQEKYWKKLTSREKPEPLQTQMFVPIFLKKFYDTLPENTRLIQMGLHELSENDMITLFEPDSVPKVDVIRAVYRRIEEGKIETFDDMVEAINKMEEPNPGTKKFFRLKIEDMKEKNLLSTEYNQDIAQYLNDGYFVSLNFKGYDQMAVGYPQAYLAVIIEKIRQARRDGILERPIFFFLDEAHVFIPRGSNPSCKQAITDVINVDRYLGESVVISTQYYNQIDLDILKQGRYYFLPYNINPEDMIKIMKMVGLHKREDMYTSKWQRLHDLLHEKRYNWLVIDRDTKKFHIVEILAPLCRHVSEKR